MRRIHEITIRAAMQKLRLDIDKMFQERAEFTPAQHDAWREFQDAIEHAARLQERAMLLDEGEAV